MEASTGPEEGVFPQLDVAMSRYQEGKDEDGVQGFMWRLCDHEKE